MPGRLTATIKAKEDAGADRGGNMHRIKQKPDPHTVKDARANRAKQKRRTGIIAKGEQPLGLGFAA